MLADKDSTQQATLRICGQVNLWLEALRKVPAAERDLHKSESMYLECHANMPLGLNHLIQLHKKCCETGFQLFATAKQDTTSVCCRKEETRRR